MESKQILKIVIDAVMAILLPFLMAQALVGETAHEWMGIGMTLLFIMHHILNRKWYGSLFKGRYTFMRAFSMATNILLLVGICVLAVSGILMSTHAVPALSVNKGMAAWRILHLLASHWGLVLMSVHAGLHGSMVFGMMRKPTKTEMRCTVRMVTLRILTVGIAGYGLYSLIHRQFFEYLFLKSQFVFFDFSEPLARFLADEAAGIFFFACVGYYAAKGIRQIRKESSMCGDKGGVI